MKGKCHDCGKKAEIDTEIGYYCLDCARTEMEYWDNEYQIHTAEVEYHEDEADDAKERRDTLERAIEEVEK